MNHRVAPLDILEVSFPLLTSRSPTVSKTSKFSLSDHISRLDIPAKTLKDIINETFPILSLENTNKEGVKSNSKANSFKWLLNGFKSQLHATNFDDGDIRTIKHCIQVLGNHTSKKYHYTDVGDIKFNSIDSKKDFLNFLIGERYSQAANGRGDLIFKFDELNRPLGLINIFSEKNLEIMTIGTEEHKKILEKLNQTAYIKTDDAKLTTITGISEQGLETTSEDLDENNVKIATNEFYPWMKGVSVAEYFADFMMSDANVLLLYGSPGTGKSTLVQTGIVKLGLSALLCANSVVSSNAEFVTKLGNLRKEENKTYDLIFIEDGDAMMRPRSEGNLALNALLSATDGVGNKNKFKLVITTNAEDTSQIDPALLRHGRCFDVMKFGNLSAVDAMKVRESLGLPEVTIKRPMSLSQVLNLDVKSRKSAQDETTAIVYPRFPLEELN